MSPYGVTRPQWVNIKGLNCIAGLSVDTVRLCNDNVIIMLTHWHRNKMDAILQTAFSNAFSWKKMLEFQIKLHWDMFLMAKKLSLVQIMDWQRPGNKSLPEPMPTHVCVQYVNLYVSTTLWCDHVLAASQAGTYFNTKMLFYKYRKSHCADKITYDHFIFPIKLHSIMKRLK